MFHHGEPQNGRGGLRLQSVRSGARTRRSAMAEQGGSRTLEFRREGDAQNHEDYVNVAASFSRVQSMRLGSAAPGDTALAALREPAKLRVVE